MEEQVQDVTEGPAVRREVDVRATPTEVWDALATEEGRAAWLEDDPGRVVELAEQDEPRRIVWWWADGGGLPTRVEITVRAIPLGSRVTVVESAPRFPIELLARSLSLALA